MFNLHVKSKTLKRSHNRQHETKFEEVKEETRPSKRKETNSYIDHQGNLSGQNRTTQSKQPKIKITHETKIRESPSEPPISALNMCSNVDICKNTLVHLNKNAQ